MIFFVLFAVFLALASASPPMTGAPGGIADAAHTINDCDYGTYEEKTHAGSPWGRRLESQLPKVLRPDEAKIRLGKTQAGGKDQGGAKMVTALWTLGSSF